MLKILITIAVALQLLLPGDEKKKKLKLVWSDEFKTTGAPDSANWTYDIGHGHDGWGNHELQYYTKSSDNIFVKDGKLVIEAKKKDGKWTSARLKSQGLKNFKYGKVEFRAKLPTGQGTWPALWLLGEKIASVGWPACGEIDVMEHVGRNPAVVMCALHTTSSHGDTQNKASTSVPTFDSEFHTYEALRTEDKIEISVDGKVYYTYQPGNKDNATWPFDESFFMIMNIAIGGGLGGEVDPALDFARMEVDYVRIYEFASKK